MSKRKLKLNGSPSVPKYALGDFVTNNSSAIGDINGQIQNLARPNYGNAMSSGLSGATSLASLGTAIAPGIGTAIGAGLGFFGGILGGSIKNKQATNAYNKQLGKLNDQRRMLTQDAYEASIDTFNENPYGVYEDGGDVIPNQINIEKGELQIDPTNGLILREFTGINPETGGLYEPHSSKGKDTDNNIVSAEEGTFIITKSKAKNYKDAIKNNDKLYQNSIMQNIRNYKKRDGSNKFRLGGDIGDQYSTYDGYYNNLFTGNVPVNGNINSNSPTYFPSSNNIVDGPVSTYNDGALFPMSGTPRNSSVASANASTPDIFGTALSYLPSLYNMVSGSQSPQYQEFMPQRLNVENRRRILDNLPREISNNIVVNNLQSQKRLANRNIDNNTANSSIARANKLALESQFDSSMNEALYNNDLLNNQIRGQRANILSQLDNVDSARDANNLNRLREVQETNRQLDLAKRQQFDTGISQFQENFMNNRMNRRLGQMDDIRLNILRSTNPYLENYLSNWLNTNNI